jgi:hypothetical protein
LFGASLVISAMSSVFADAKEIVEGDRAHVADGGYLVGG